GLAAGLGLPGLAGFWGEFPAIIAALDPGEGRSSALFAVCAAVAAIGAVLAAAYALRVARLVWLGEGYLDAPPEPGPGAGPAMDPDAGGTADTRTMPVAAADIAGVGRSGE